MHNYDLALNNPQWLNCHKTQPSHHIIVLQLIISCFNRLIVLLSRVCAYSPVPGHVIRKTFKMVLDTTLFHTSGAIQRKELRPTLHLVVVDIEKGAFGSLSTKVADFTY